LALALNGAVIWMIPGMLPGLKDEEPSFPCSMTVFISAPVKLAK